MACGMASLGARVAFLVSAATALQAIPRTLPRRSRGALRARAVPEPRSFVRRQGQATKAQKRALRELWPVYGVDMPWNRTISDVGAEVFGRAKPRRTVLDVGCGMGDSLVGGAARDPRTDYLGLEVHVPGVGACVQKARAAGDLANVRVCRVDALAFLRDHVSGPDHFDVACVYFPDPWFHEKDARRRIVRPSLLEHLARVLKPGGVVRVATDVDGYAAHVARVFAEDGRYRPTRAG